MNLDTLENRLQALIKRNSLNNQNERYQQQSNANVSMGTMIPTPNVSMGTMIPTPGISQSGNSNSIMSSAVNQGGFSMNTAGPSRNMHTGSFDGTYPLFTSSFIYLSIYIFIITIGSTFSGGLTDGSQQAISNFSSTGGQRIGSQMMPTPGFNNTNNSTSNQSYVKMEPTNNVSVISNADSAMVSQPMQQKQQVGGQNSRILHSLGSHMGGGIRSTLAQKSYGFPNGSLNGNLGMMGKSSQMVNSLGNSEGFLTDSHYASSPKLVPQYYDQHQGQLSQGTLSPTYIFVGWVSYQGKTSMR